jgi:hypothetical protein
LTGHHKRERWVPVVGIAHAQARRYASQARDKTLRARASLYANLVDIWYVTGPRLLVVPFFVAELRNVLPDTRLFLIATALPRKLANAQSTSRFRRSADTTA